MSTNWHELEAEFLEKERKWKNDYRASEAMAFISTVFWTIVDGLITGTGLYMWLFR